MCSQDCTCLVDDFGPDTPSPCTHVQLVLTQGNPFSEWLASGAIEPLQIMTELSQMLSCIPEIPAAGWLQVQTG